MLVYFPTASNDIPGSLALLACTSQNKADCVVCCCTTCITATGPYNLKICIYSVWCSSKVRICKNSHVLRNCVDSPTSSVVHQRGLFAVQRKYLWWVWGFFGFCWVFFL